MKSTPSPDSTLPPGGATAEALGVVGPDSHRRREIAVEHFPIPRAVDFDDIDLDIGSDVLAEDIEIRANPFAPAEEHPSLHWTVWRTRRQDADAVVEAELKDLGAGDYRAPQREVGRGPPEGFPRGPGDEGEVLDAVAAGRGEPGQRFLAAVVQPDLEGVPAVQDIQALLADLPADVEE